MSGSDRKMTGSKGFTLIDASIVLLIIGILMVPILKAIDIAFLQRKMEDTNERFAMIDKAIDEYISSTNPIPAPPIRRNRPRTRITARR